MLKITGKAMTFVMAFWTMFTFADSKLASVKVEREDESTKKKALKKVIVIDERVKDFLEIFGSNGLDNSFVISKESDGLKEVSALLKKYTKLDSLHIIAHAEKAKLVLGKEEITTDVLNKRRSELNVWRKSFKHGGDLMVYGCNLANGSEGAGFIAALATHTGLDIAASTDITGAKEKDGDWQLEFKLGSIESPLIANTEKLMSYNGVLRKEVARSVSEQVNK